MGQYVYGIIGAAAVIEVGRLPARADIERVIDRHGVWLRPFGNFIYAMPPLVSDAKNIARITVALASSPCDKPPMPSQTANSPTSPSGVTAVLISRAS